MLTDATLDRILQRIPALTFGVVGDLFLDRYLDIDARLTEPSLETRLDAYQVVKVRPSAGAAGTVINNLAALGVKRIIPIAVIGDDGEGYELGQALDRLNVVARENILRTGLRRTPTYTKPMLCEPGRPPRELNRLDIKNHTPLDPDMETWICDAVDETWPHLDGLLVSDQVSEPDCGVITGRVRRHLATVGETRPEKLILADSRERIGLFRSVWLKPNEAESRSAAESPEELARRAGRPVFCTCGQRGIYVVDPKNQKPVLVSAYPVTGPIDIVGAGDSTSAGIACGVAAGATLEEAAAFGNLVASITIQQIGTTGTASPEQVRRRWEEINGRP